MRETVDPRKEKAGKFFFFSFLKWSVGGIEVVTPGRKRTFNFELFT